MAVTGACMVVVWVYFWIARPAMSQLGNTEANGAYYNLLIDGFLAGQLHLKIEARPELAQLANPYDPLQNGYYRLHDATYFQGRYYLYFGITPALALFLPYVLITGNYLFHSEVVALYCAASFVTAAGLLCAARRRYFPGLGIGAMTFLVAGLGLVNAMPIMLRRPDVWEVPIACASFFVMLSLASIWRALHAPRGRILWVLVASATYGLAVGARPPVLLGSAMLLVPVFTFWRAGGVGRAVVGRMTLAAFGPIVLIGFALMAFNWVRFGNALEFGQKYQLAGVDNTKQTFFRLGYFWYHVRLYLWEPVQWSSYFPFNLGIRVPPAPPGQLGVESVFGVLKNLPFVWLALWPLVSASKQTASNDRWRSWVLAVGLVAGICSTTVFFFGGATNRYFVDFLPAWILLAAFGVLGIEQWASGRSRLLRWLLRSVWVASLAFSSAVCYFASCEHLDLLRSLDGESYRRQVRFWNTPVSWWEQWRGVRYGPIELRLKLPPFKTARTEPLLMTGFGVRADYIWIHFDDSEHLRVGMEHTGRGGPVSAPITVDYDREQVVVISMGSLYPPATHPWHRAVRSPVEAFSRQMLSVSWNGQEVLRGHQATYDASPETRHVGVTPGVHNFGDRFSGRIVSQRTLEPPSSTSGAETAGRIMLDLHLGPVRAPGTVEPLVQTGETGRADTLFMRFIDESRIVVGLDHWGYGGPESPPFEIDRTKVNELEIHMGSLDSAVKSGSPTAAPRKRLLVRVNGKTVLDAEQEFYPATATEVFFGQNPVRASMAELFSGRILDVRPIAATR